MITSANCLGIDDSHIVPVDEKVGLAQETKDSFCAMQQAAFQDGIDIQIVSGYRSFDRQLAIWQAKWEGERPLYSLDNQPLDYAILSELERLHSILIWSALPGASRHHWGTDLDVYDKKSVESSGEKFQLITPEYEENGVCFELNCWLSENANRFGFTRPYAHYSGGVAPEPWHLSYQPIAEQVVQNLSLDALAVQLQKSDIGGKELILNLLESLFVRYTLNQGKN